jgi:hypothetical protein
MLMEVMYLFHGNSVVKRFGYGLCFSEPFSFRFRRRECRFKSKFAHSATVSLFGALSVEIRLEQQSIKRQIQVIQRLYVIT